MIPLQGSFEANSSDPAKQINIAVAQILPSSSGLRDVDGLIELEAIAQRAAREGADVVVFPEYFLSGATHEQWRQVAHQGSPLPAPIHPDELDEEHWIALIQKIARENEIDIVAGTVVELGTHQWSADPAQKTPLYNTAYYISRSGAIAGRYTKRNLWHPERQTLTAAHDESHPHDASTFVIETKRGGRFRAGMLICWDLAWPEMFRQMLSKSEDPSSDGMVGPDVIFIPTCWYLTDNGPKGLKWNRYSEASLLDSMVITRAIENEAVVVMCNIAGPEWPEGVTELTTDEPIGIGRTAVAAPFLGAVGRVEHPRETLLLASVDMTVVQDARDVYRIRHDLQELQPSSS